MERQHTSFDIDWCTGAVNGRNYFYFLRWYSHAVYIHKHRKTDPL